MIFIYIVCFIFRLIEYFVLRTDETFLGEAFVHKLIGIVILFTAARIYGFKPAEIGFAKSKVLRSLTYGLAFGLIIFIPAYFVEIIIVILQGKFETLALYVSTYSVNGNIGSQTNLVFFVICIIGNIINIIMEEGIFRGLFQKILEKKYSFLLSAAISSCFFGLWHIVPPFRSYFDGAMNCNSFIVNAIMLVVTSGLAGFQFALMTKLTNSIYMAMGYHFFNNTIVNMLHVISSTGADELMVIRITVAQAASFIIILIWFILTQHKQVQSGK